MGVIESRGIDKHHMLTITCIVAGNTNIGSLGFQVMADMDIIAVGYEMDELHAIKSFPSLYIMDILTVDFPMINDILSLKLQTHRKISTCSRCPHKAAQKF